MTIVGLRKPINENPQLGYDPTDFIYINDSIKLFEDEIDASTYRDYLNTSNRYSKDYTSFSAPIEAYPQGGLDIDALIREDAINRLTPEERRVLGV